MENQTLKLPSQPQLTEAEVINFNLIKLPKFPATRYQGSKRKILPELANAINTLKFNNVLDMFSGSGIVSLMFRYLEKNVSSNDFMLYSQNTAKVFQSFDLDKLNRLEVTNDLDFLLNTAPIHEPLLVSNIYEGIYFIKEENLEIDRFCQNIHSFPEFEQSVYIYAIGQALTKKRPYNLFHRANLGMRTKDVKRSFGNKKTWETSIMTHAIKCIDELKKFIICPSNDSQVSVTGHNSADLDSFDNNFDLIYLDPPYIKKSGVPLDYSDFYHFLDGLCQYDLYKSANEKYPHKPIAKKPSAWLKADTALHELSNICKRWPDSTVILSYRSDGQPTPIEAANAMMVNGRTTEIHSAGEYKYVLSKTNTNEELIIISRPREI